MVTTTASDALWSASSTLGLVPGRLRADSPMGKAVATWQGSRRTRGCRHRRAVVAVLPGTALWCLTCSQEQARTETRCAACHRSPGPAEPIAAVWAEHDAVLFLARICTRCDNDHHHDKEADHGRQ